MELYNVEKDMLYETLSPGLKKYHVTELSISAIGSSFSMQESPSVYQNLRFPKQFIRKRDAPFARWQIKSRKCV
jgi:hypothetical protein